MAYCDLTSVQKLLKWFEFSTTSKVTIDEVNNEFIPEIDTVIDSKLRRVYTVPITDSDDIEILQYIACRMVACEIAHILILQADGEVSDIVLRWCEQAKERLNEILNQEILLPNSDLLDSVNGGRLYSFTAHGSTFVDEDAPDVKWKMSTDQW